MHSVGEIIQTTHIYSYVNVPDEKESLFLTIEKVVLPKKQGNAIC